MEFTTAEIEFLAKLVSIEKLDSLTVGSLVIKKSLHTSVKDEKPVALTSKLSSEQFFGPLPQAALDYIAPKKRGTQDKE